VKDLLERRGEAYADRPTLPIVEMCALYSHLPTICKVNNLISRMEMDWVLFNSRKGDPWHEGRKVLDRNLQPGAMISYHQIMQENTHQFLAQLLATPKEFCEHVKLFFTYIFISHAH
jgi:hypothetical protein